MSHKRASYELAEFKADAAKTGEFTAIVSVFGNVDKIGDRVMPGAFANSLAKWEGSGAPIPVIWSHDWKDPFSNIGAVTKAVEVEKGLQVTGKLDVDSNPIAAQVFKLLDERRVKEFSFGYQIADGGERRAKDGANELTELELLEVGPTFRGMNPATELLATKAATETLADTLTELGLDLDALRGIKSEGPAPLVIKVEGPSDDDLVEIMAKAGATHSRATRDRLAAHRQRLSDALADVDDLLGTADDADEPKSQTSDREPTAKPESEPEQPEPTTDREPTAKTVDDETLALTLSVEEALLS